MLTVKHIKKSIEVMDEFEFGDYDYLELKGWFCARKSSASSFSVYDNSNRFEISLMISKTRDKTKSLISYEPTMTELRQMQYRSVNLDGNYPKDSLIGVIRDACVKWEKDIYIELDMEICLRAQNSMNRTDYGCEWLGGGDWEEKTLYGETTNYFITGIMLRDPYKFPEQKAKEKIESLQAKYEEEKSILEQFVELLKKYDGIVYNKKFGEGKFYSFTDKTVTIKFKERTIEFQFPECVWQDYIKIPSCEELIENIKELAPDIEETKKEIKALENALLPGNRMELYDLIFNKYYK